MLYVVPRKAFHHHHHHQHHHQHHQVTRPKSWPVDLWVEQWTAGWWELEEDTWNFWVLDAYWLSEWDFCVASWSRSLEFRKDIEAGIIFLVVSLAFNGWAISPGIINSRAISCVESALMWLPHQRGSTGHMVSRLPIFLGYSHLSISLTLQLNLGRVTSD